MADMAILQEIDKCYKCRACTVACQRVQGLTQAVGGAEKVESDDPVVIKAQRSVDNPPFVRYSCWHCVNPPCVPACPLGAMKVDSATGAVYVDNSLCDPTSCSRQCVTNCRRGGYPKVGTNAPGYHAYKCNLCYNRPGGPECVKTCPAKALKYDTLSNIESYIAVNYPTYKIGDGHVFWASKANFDPPTTDPFIEDHISPMFSRLLTSPAGKLLALPGVIFGALYALYRRRTELASAKKA